MRAPKARNRNRRQPNNGRGLNRNNGEAIAQRTRPRYSRSVYGRSARHASTSSPPGTRWRLFTLAVQLGLDPYFPRHHPPNGRGLNRHSGDARSHSNRPLCLRRPHFWPCVFAECQRVACGRDITSRCRPVTRPDGCRTGSCRPARARPMSGLHPGRHLASCRQPKPKRSHAASRRAHAGRGCGAARR